MAKVKTVHRCTECGGSSPRWTGRCPSCEAWNSLVEELESHAARPVGGLAGGVGVPATAAPITSIDGGGSRPVPTGVAELDRVLGGGLVPGSVTVVGGEPGAGKSTLLLATAASLAAAGHRTLYVSAEEGEQQVRGRAERLGALHPELWLLAETVLPPLLAPPAPGAPPGGGRGA